MYLYSEGIYDYHQRDGKTIKVDTETWEEEVTDPVSQKQLIDSTELRSNYG